MKAVWAIKNALDFVLSWLIIGPVFYLVVWYDFIHTTIKECYFIVFRIPYYKMHGKFNYYIVRKNK